MYQPEPDQDKAQRQANLLLVFVIGVLIGASLVAIIAISQCSSSEESPRVVVNERVITREVRKVVDVPKVVTREVEVDVTREVEVMRVVTRVVTKEVDSPRVVTRVVEVIDGTPTIPTPTPAPTKVPPTATTIPPTVAPNTSLTDAEAIELIELTCELLGAYQVDIVPHLETWADALVKLLQPENLERINSGLAGIDRAANALRQIDPHPVAENLHAQLIDAFEGYVEPVAILRDVIDDASDGASVSEARVKRAYTLFNRARDDILSVIETLDELNQTCERSTRNATPTITPSRKSVAEANSSVPSTTCNLIEVRAYVGEMLPIIAEGLDAFQRTGELINIVESNPFVVQDASWRRRMGSALDDMDIWATSTINVQPPDAISQAHQFLEAAARLYMERITPNIRRGITNIDSVPVQSVVADAYEAADLLNDGADYVEDYFERCE